METDIKRTMEQARMEMNILSKIYSKVRLLSREELCMDDSDDACWRESCLGGGEYCEDCVSAMSMNDHRQKTKLKYIGTELYEVTARYLEIDGKPYVMELIQALDNSDSSIENAIDCRDNKDADEFYTALYSDALTGAYNRRYYEEQLKKRVMSAGVAMFDMDDFKLANDTYGHDIGDTLLTTEVSVIKKLIRKTDSLVRYGGDEFMLVMPGISQENFDSKLRDIRRLISSTELPGSQQIQMSVSIGGVMAQNETIREAVARADKYMYQAKAHKNAIATEWGMIELSEHSVVPARKKKSEQCILIVDDSEMNRAILCEMLKEEFATLEAENGEEALDMIQKYGRKISLVLLDIVMPVMDGFEVLDKMNSTGIIEDMPVIMISSEDSSTYIRKAYEMGVSDYISRPYDAKIVYRRVFNTIKLYAKQRRLTAILSEQMKAKERNNKIMVGILSHIVEFRNGESGAHVQHINVLTQMLLGRLVQKTDQYDLTWQDRETIVMASSLHDIGKIGIDDKILNKRGKLTDEEFDIMKQHTVIGASILEELTMYQDEPLIKTAYQVCRWHHERYDGRGYPDGLKGEEIPIAAQVVSLADVYDALVSKRVYKKSFSHETAMHMIFNGECGVFNPLLLECLRDIQNDIYDAVYEEDNEIFDSKDKEGQGIEKLYEKSDNSGGGRALNLAARKTT